MTKAHQEFLDLFHPQPGYKLLEVTTHAGEISSLLIDFLKPYDGRLAVAQYPGEHESFEASENLKLQNVPDFTKVFRALPRDNDIVILNDILHRHHLPDRILKAVYTTLANTGEVIIMAPKGEMDLHQMCQELENAEYRAPNPIDIFAEYDLVMAKKMHMWGNGL